MFIGNFDKSLVYSLRRGSKMANRVIFRLYNKAYIVINVEPLFLIRMLAVKVN